MKVTKKTIKKRYISVSIIIAMLALIMTPEGGLNRPMNVEAVGEDPISAFSFDYDSTYKFTNSSGDTFDFAWADDGNLYTTHCDGSGFGTVPGNFGIDKLTGSAGSWPNYSFNQITGQIVNPMHDANYPQWDYNAPGQGDAWWKTIGLTCVNNVLYLFVSPNGTESNTMRQTAGNVTLIKSTDHGVTWSDRADPSNGMFPGMYFGAPAFVKFGQNGAASVDGADQYVYAVSTNGFMSNGDYMTIGRVLKSNIGDLDAADWQFYNGPIGGDITSANNWISDVTSSTITKILESPGNLGQCDVTYIEPLDRYVMLTWGWLYDDGSFNDTESSDWYYPAPHFNREFTTFIQVYESASPTGGWTQVGSTIYSNDPLAYYNPHIINKFTEVDGVNPNIVHTVVGVAGEWQSNCYIGNETSSYNLNLIPLTLYAGNTINATEAAVTSGTWTVGSGTSVYSSTDGAYKDFYIDVAKAGNYVLNTHVYNAVDHTSPQEIYVNDYLVDTRTTNDGTQWTTITNNVVLRAGRNVIRVKCKGPYTHFDTISWAFSSNLSTSGSISARLPGYSYGTWTNGGYSATDVYSAQDGAYRDYYADVNNAGIYKLDTHVYNASNHTSPQEIYVNDVLVDSRLTNSGTGWSTISLNVNFKSGRNIIRVKSRGPYTHFDNIDWSLASLSGSVSARQPSYSYGTWQNGGWSATDVYSEQDGAYREYIANVGISGMYELGINVQNAVNHTAKQELYVNGVLIDDRRITNNGTGFSMIYYNVMFLSGNNIIKIKCRGPFTDFDNITWELVPTFRDFGAANGNQPNVSSGSWNVGLEPGQVNSSQNGAYRDYNMNVNTEGVYGIYLVTKNAANHTSPQQIIVNGELVNSTITNNGTDWSRITISKYLKSGNNIIRIYCTGPYVDYKFIFWSLDTTPYTYQ